MYKDRKLLQLFTIHSLLTTLFIGGLLLTVWEVNIYRKTIIPVGLPLLIWLGTGLIITPFLKSFLKREYNTQSVFLQIVFNIVAWGGITVFVFMWSNSIFATNEVKVARLRIIKIGYLAKGRNGCGEPYVNIAYNSKTKQLIFPCDTEVEAYKYVAIELKKGLWGFDIIANQQLIKEQQPMPR